MKSNAIQNGYDTYKRVQIQMYTRATVWLQPNRVGSQMCGLKPLQYNTNTLQALTGFDIKCVDQPWRAPNRW